MQMRTLRVEKSESQVLQIRKGASASPNYEVTGEKTCAGLGKGKVRPAGVKGSASYLANYLTDEEKFVAEMEE